ncbi:hypothetical protein [Kribbella swartbergensis]
MYGITAIPAAAAAGRNSWRRSSKWVGESHTVYRYVFADSSRSRRISAGVSMCQ